MTKKQRIIAKLRELNELSREYSNINDADILKKFLRLESELAAIESEQEEDRDIHTYFYKRILEILKSNFYPLGEVDDDAQCAEMITQFVLDKKEIKP